MTEQNKIGLEVFNNSTPESIRWLFDRLDGWRSSIANRCSLVLSANALLLAANSFLLDKVFDFSVVPNNISLIVIIALIIISMLLLLISLIFSTIGIANVWKTSRENFAKDTPSRLLFHPSDIINNYKSYEQFISKFSSISENDVVDAMYSEMWSLFNMHHKRYQMLRKSIQLLVIGIPFYVIAIASLIFYII